MTAYITLNTASELSCLVISILCLYRDKDPVWRSFILFMLLTCLVELSGIYLRNRHLPNFMLYNVFLVIECAVLNYFFYHLFKANHNLKKLLTGWLILFIIFYFIELYVKHFNAYVSVSSTIVSVELILASVYYYYLLLKEEKFRQLWKDAPFWWVNGTICFYFAGIACNIFFKYLLQDKTPQASSANYIVFSVLNVILYSCWSYSFICRYFQRTSPSS
ncbi:hypothetical protein FAM09_16840 [Niastella caeni]|uniref:Uncharacterized protein n=1 Tax=Niastella caeni TaxID=2569763 RepID=A0A4S8HYM6_9BACT|nr:hypothetical protein [Niastella caeni]THU38342.1 hypothetical protein FAM09_16840 [Niastella caeni]